MKTLKRFIVMSVPTDTDAFWFVYDRETGKSVECDSMMAAGEVCRLNNREYAWQK